jgi:hypothetical protein
VTEGIKRLAATFGADLARIGEQMSLTYVVRALQYIKFERGSYVCAGDVLAN